MDLGAQYMAFVSSRDAAGAEEYITDKLAEAVDEGELDSLPALYAHRAVWRLQLGLLRKAEKDLNAAQRVKLSPEAEVEVQVLLAQCYLELDRGEDAARVISLARQGIAKSPAPSALLLRHALAGGAAMAPGAAPKRTNGATSASDAGTASRSAHAGPASAAPVPANGLAAPAANGAADAGAGAVQRSNGKRSMAGGFLGNQKPRAAAATATSPSTPAPAPTTTAAEPVPVEQVSPNVGAAAGPLHADTVSDPVATPVQPARAPIAPSGEGSHGDDVDDSAAAPIFGGAGGKVEIIDLDMDELDNALNTPPQTMTSLSPAAQQRLLKIMGTPGAPCCCPSLCAVCCIIGGGS